MHTGGVITDMIGRRLAHYEITAHLGSGGMGDVFQATDSKLGRTSRSSSFPTLRRRSRSHGAIRA